MGCLLNGMGSQKGESVTDVSRSTLRSLTIDTTATDIGEPDGIVYP